eukprot:SM000017S02887  [mRNA]  locus=s17:887138:900859:+ [translate_table: standard]
MDAKCTAIVARQLRMPGAAPPPLPVASGGTHQCTDELAVLPTLPRRHHEPVRALPAWRLAAALAAALLAVAAAAQGGRPPRRYDTRASPVPSKLNVHLVPHSHDDVGWLKTVDQYYVGSNNSIQIASVQYILDSVVEKLLENPDRKFIYVEQAFFQRWWREQSRNRRRTVKKLVKAGQLEFINGGWCMHDEAATHYVDMIDQTTLGHRYILDQFGDDHFPRIGWQIDPFGHSATQASLLSAEVGFDALFFARADYDDIKRRRKDLEMEMIWRGSKSLAESAQIFAGLLGHHYDPPEGFRYEIKSQDPPIQDDPLLFDDNVEERVNAFVEAAKEQSSQFRTNHIMWTMGEDFSYSNANTWYKNMDKLIHYVNRDGRVHAMYSTPSIYIDAKHSANETWPLKHNDFFPYADCPNCYWTGFFTSRPAFKGYVRKLSGYLQAARQLEAAVGRRTGSRLTKFNDSGPSTTDLLEEALAISQHHDAVSGTERQHVADDYAKRLHMGAVKAEQVVSAALEELTSLQSASRRAAAVDPAMRRTMLADEEDVLMEDTTHKAPFFQQCDLLNISYCPVTEKELRHDDSLVLVAYNPLGWHRKELIKIPVSSSELVVTDKDGNTVPAQLVPLSRSTKRLRNIYASLTRDKSKDDALYTLLFYVEVLPLGFSTYCVTALANGTAANTAGRAVMAEEDASGMHSQEAVASKAQLLMAQGSSRLSHLKAAKDSLEVAVSFHWYNASDGNTEEKRNQASGAYIFRPNSSTAFDIWKDDQLIGQRIWRGPVAEEWHQWFSPWLSQVVRVHKGEDHAEVEYTVGPIPIDDNLGKEVITRLTTNMDTGNVFFTDSNGRDYIKRALNYREDWELNVTQPVAGNYYPVNAGMYMSDTHKDLELSILTDRSLGGTSLKDGQLELMLHRRLLNDDHRGVGESLNETTCTEEPPVCEGLMVRGVFYVHAGRHVDAAVWRRQFAQRLYSPLLLAFTRHQSGDEGSLPFSLDVLSSSQSVFGSADFELPKNVAILTLQELEEKVVLLRLAHLFEVDESEELSRLANVDIAEVFASRQVQMVEELNLTGRRRKEGRKPLRWRVEEDMRHGDRVDTVAAARKPVRGRPLEESDNGAVGKFVVELGPMEIRTFYDGEQPAVVITIMVNNRASCAGSQTHIETPQMAGLGRAGTLPAASHNRRAAPQPSPAPPCRRRFAAAAGPSPSDHAAWRELLRGGDQVTAVLQQMTDYLADISDLADAEAAAVQMAAAGAVGAHIEVLDRAFLLALDFMLHQAQKDHDDKREWLLQVLKDQVQVVGLLCRTKDKEERREVLCRAAGGGGVFDAVGGGKFEIPAAKLGDVAAQADDVVSSMEERQAVPDRRLLARLVLVREEARSLAAGGHLDPRNDTRGLQSLAQPEVDFLAKVVGMRPGPALRTQLQRVMEGKDDGEDRPGGNSSEAGPAAVRLRSLPSRGPSTGNPGDNDAPPHSAAAAKGEGRLPVRPGLFLDTVTKVLGGLYSSGSARGVTVQQLEFIREEVLAVLQNIAHS